MAENILKGTIKLDAPGVKETANQVAEGVNKMQSAIKNTIAPIDQATTRNKNYKSSLSDIPKVANDVSQSAQRMANSATAAGGAISKTTTNFTGLTRVIQDLPFGFIAISNNLEQLLPAAGGLGLAFSAIVSGLSFAQTGLSNWTRGLGSSKESLEDQVKAIHDARQELENYVETLNDVDKARVTGLQNAQEELVNLKTLYDAIQNVNIPLAKRKELVDQLQEQYPKYFGNIKDEIILAGGAEQAYKNLSSAIIAAAKARAAQDSIVDIQKQVLTLDQQISQNASEQIKAQQRINKLRQAPQTDILQGKESLSVEAVRANQIQEDLNQIISRGNELRKQRNDLDDRAKQLSSFLQTTVQQNPNALLKLTARVDDKKSKDESKKLKEDLEEKLKIIDEFQKDFNVLRLPFPNLDVDKLSAKELTRELRDRLNDALLHQPLKLSLPTDFKAFNIKEIPLPLKPTIVFEKSDLQKEFEKFKEVGKQIGDKIGAGFGDAFEQIFSDTFTAALFKGLQGKQLDNFKSAFTAISGIAADGIKGIADAFAGFTDALLRGENGMKAFGNALKGVFKSLAVEIIRDIVLAGILSALTGGVGAASGKGLSFLGALGKLIGGSHATGLKRVPKDGYIAELHKDEMVVPARAADMLRSVMDSNFSIPSVSSVGFSRLNNTSNILAGAERKSIDVNISAVLRASGPDLVATHYKTLRAQKITS